MNMKRYITRMLCAASLLSLTASAVHAEQTDEHTPAAFTAEDLYSDYVFVEDYTTGQILYDQGSTERIYPASMTKMMTVLVALENLTNLDERYYITYQMLDGLAEANASVMGLYAGDNPTIEDLMYGAALPSGADACNALAFRVADGVNAFVDMMNDKAAEIGMTSTHFVNPTGLHEDNHYTTCRDMAKLLEYALQNDTFREIFSADSYTTSSIQSAAYGITCYSTSKSTIWNNGYDIPGFVGAKTGFTYEAGHCMSYWADLNDMDLILVTAHADTGYYDPSHIDDAETILQYYDTWERQELFTTGKKAGEITVHFRNSDRTIPICTTEDLILDYPKGKNIVLTTTFPEEVNAGLSSEKLFGDIILTADDEVLYCQEMCIEIPKETSFWGRLKLIISDLFH